MKRFLFALMLTLGLLLPAVSQAQLDQKCWLEQECYERRREISNNSLTETQIKKGGFVVDNITREACGGDTVGDNKVGFCLPAGQAETKISFGGETKFENIGTFIKSMYRYTIWVAGILAVAMVIVAGFQWAASGGNSESITSAKKRISGAMAGLILLLLSYTILSTINPYLVNFRLPQVWLINTQGLIPNFCSELDASFAEKKLRDVGEAGEKIPAADPSGNVFTKTQAEAECGRQYMVEKGGSQVCWGGNCENKDKICNPFVYKDPNTGKKVGPHCETGDLVVMYSMKGFLSGAAANLPLIGAAPGIHTTEEDNWLELLSPNKIEFDLIGICAAPSKKKTPGMIGELCTTKLRDNSVAKVVRIPGGLIPDYIVTYGNLAFADKVYSCPGNKTLVGLMVAHEVEKEWSTVEGLLYMSWPRSGQSAYTGDYFELYKAMNSEPGIFGDTKRFEDAEKSKRYLYAAPSDEDIYRVLKYNWRWEDYTCD